MEPAFDAPANGHDGLWSDRNLARLIKIFTTLVCSLTPLIALAAALIHLRQGWDDGAITVAFSRTFHSTGRIALTPISEVVEGFSSISWMLILSGLDNFSHTAEAMLVSSKVASAVAFGLSLLMFARHSGRFLAGPLRFLAIALLALLITPFCEVINGMEMNLYMLLVLALAETMMVKITNPLKWLGAAVLSSAILLTRFESPFLLFFLYLGIFLSSRKRADIAALGFLNAFCFVLSEVWRHRLFGQWLPNTIIAKRWPPYSTHRLIPGLVSRLEATAEVFLVLLLPLAVLGGLWVLVTISHKPHNGGLKTYNCPPLLLSMTIGAVVLALVMGRNWGHPGRMYQGFLPFVILAVVSACRTLLEGTSLSLPRFVAVILVCQALVWIGETRLLAFRLTPYVTVEHVGLAADQLRGLLAQDTLSVFIPDVGASALCCEKLNIMDSALLANGKLAQQGYSGVPTFVRTNRPDVIGTHDPWAKLSGLYEPQALSGYKEVEIRGERFFVREDLYTRLSHMGFVQVTANDRITPCVTKEESVSLAPSDRDFLALQPECLLISQ